MARTEPGVKAQGVISIIKSLGLVGLTRGITACLARDVPFVSPETNSIAAMLM